MTLPVFVHDQVITYIKSDADKVTVDGRNSYDTIAQEFEAYWRTVIAEDMRVQFDRIEKELGLISIEVKREILLTIWRIK